MDFAPGFAPQAPDITAPATPISSFQSPIVSAPTLHPTPGINDATRCNLPATQCNMDATKCNPNATECNVDATGSTPHSTPATLTLSDYPITTNDAQEILNIPAQCNQNEEIDPSTSLFDLSPMQDRAIDLLLAGRSVQGVARDLGIHRVTLFRWRTLHPRFIAELTRRSTLNQFDASLAARQALDISMKTVLGQLRLKTSGNLDLATRLLNSPRLARLAAASAPVPMRQVLADLYQSRTLNPLPTDPPDPALVDDLASQLAEELQAPIPPDPPKPTPKPKAPKESTWADIYRDNQSRRSPRKDLVEALAIYITPGEYLDPTQIAIIVRRPDLLPIDIHYLVWEGYRRNRLKDCLHYLAKAPICGVGFPLRTGVLVLLIQAGHIKRLGGHDLTNCQPSATGYEETAALVLAFPAPNPFTLTIPGNSLWRDALTCPDLPIPGAV